MDKLTQHSAHIRRILAKAKELELSPEACRRLKWFVFTIEHEGNVSLTCRHFAIPRSTYYKWLNAFDPDEPQTLNDKSSAPKRVRTPDEDPAVIACIREQRESNPHIGKEAICDYLRNEHAIDISASTVGRIIARYGFFFGDTPAHKRKRATVEEAYVVNELITREMEQTHSMFLHWSIAVEEQEHKRSSSRRGNGGMLLALALFVGALGMGVDSASAAESSSYRLYDASPNMADGEASESATFRLNENGTTWQESPLASTSFQIVSAPPAVADEESGDGGDSGDNNTGGGANDGGGSGRRPCPTTGKYEPCPSSSPDTTPSEGEPTSPEPGHPTAPTPEDKTPPPASHPADRPTVHPSTPSAPLVRPDLTVDDIRNLIVRGDSKLSEGDMPLGFFDDVLRWCAEQQTEVICPEVPTHSAAPIVIQESSFPWTLLIVLLLIVLTVNATVLLWLIRQAAGKEISNTMKASRWIGMICVIAAAGVMVLLIPRTFANTTGPQTHVYNGHLLDASGNAITTAHKVRFSYWKSADFVSSDLTAGGAIDTGAANYLQWYEEHTVTPNSDGYFSVHRGSITPLPDLSTMTASTLSSIYMQVEVKPALAADTSYELLDTDPDSTTIDRSAILSVPFALNADLLDQRDTGTSSGSIPVLLSGGLLPVSTIPGGTTRSTFIVDVNDGSSGDITLQFGTTLAKTFLYSQANTRFEFNDAVYISGALTTSQSITIGNYQVGSGTGAGTIRWTGTDFEGYNGSSWTSLTTGVGGGGSGAIIQSGDVTVVQTGAVLDFNGNDFTVTEGPPSEANIALNTTGLKTRLDDQYVNQGGDTMTGELLIAQESGSNALSASGAIRTENGLVINYKNAAQDAVLTFGNDLGAQTFRFSDVFNEFALSAGLRVANNLSVSGSLSVETGQNVSLNGVSYLFPASGAATSGAILKSDASGSLGWGLINSGSLALRTKRMFIPMHDVTIIPDGSDNSVNVFAGTETGSTSNIHHYLRFSTSSGVMQDVDLRLKIQLPKDFVDFASATDDIRFSYKTTGASAAQSKIDILVEDDDGDDAFTAADGEDLFSGSWTEYTDEFDGGSFDPSADEFIYVTIKGYATSAGEPFVGELVITYTAR